jgi:predicted nucleic acid-binding protein
LRIEPVADYEAVDGIIHRYARLRCDYADATLVALAERTGVMVVATIDQRDFSVYRARGKRFRIVLGA